LRFDVLVLVLRVDDWILVLVLGIVDLVLS